MEESSSDEGNRVTRKKVSEGEFQIILSFRKEDEHIKLSPIALTRELRKKLGEVEMGKILWHGNFLVMCQTEEQRNKARQVESICKKVVAEGKVLGLEMGQNRESSR